MRSWDLASLRPVYLEHLLVRGYAESTVASREYFLRKFEAWCEERSVRRAVDVTKPMAQRYQRWLFRYRKTDGDPLSFANQAARLNALKCFFGWLAKNNYILFSPAADIEMPKIERRLPKHVFTLAEVERVLAQPDIDTAPGLRDRAVMETLYSTGMRRSEVIALAVHDLDNDRGVVHIRKSKTGVARVVPIGERALAWIRRYTDEVRPELVVDPLDATLFLNRFGTPMNPSTLSNRLRCYIRDAKTGKTGSCHIFRHTMATLMLEHGADVRHIQAILGHADLNSTQIYTHVSIRQLQDAHARAHPGATLERHRSPTLEERKTT